MRYCYLSTVELHRLDRACRDLWNIARNNNGGVYLVGSVTKRPDFRDVDVRMILPDEAFDRMLGSEPSLWGLFCYAVSRQLGADTGLPIDFQVQRQTQANEHPGTRNPLGLIAIEGDDLHMGRDFAGGGDATRFTSPLPDPAPAGEHLRRAECINPGDGDRPPAETCRVERQAVA